jgi:hypothetical protein
MQNMLASLPVVLRDELFRSFNEIVRNYRERRWEPSELNGGKLSEVVYSILEGHVSGTFPSKPSKPRNMLAACQAFEQADAQRFCRAVRIQIPRMLIALYEIRNNRGVGHVGGDVNPNLMDATAVLAMSKWVVAEVLRIFHSVTTDEATAAVEKIIERTLPVVWVVEDRIRILNPSLSMKVKSLLVLYQSQGWVAEDSLLRAVEHSNASVFRRDVLKRSHREKLIEYDAQHCRVLISPLGVDYVERTLLVSVD